VRTPLNAVNMGLTLLIEELGTTLARFQRIQDSSELLSPESTCSNTCVDEELALTKANLDGWLTLAEDIQSSATVSVDVLNVRTCLLGSLSVAFCACLFLFSSLFII